MLYLWPYPLFATNVSYLDSIVAALWGVCPFIYLIYRCISCPLCFSILLIYPVIKNYALVLNRRENAFSKLHKMESRVHYFPVSLYVECKPSVVEIDAGRPGTVSDWPNNYVDNSRVYFDSSKLLIVDFYLCPVRNSSLLYMLLILNVKKWELLILDPSVMPSPNFHLNASYFVVNLFTICVTTYLFLFITVSV